MQDAEVVHVTRTGIKFVLTFPPDNVFTLTGMTRCSKDKPLVIHDLHLLVWMLSCESVSGLHRKMQQSKLSIVAQTKCPV